MYIFIPENAAYDKQDNPELLEIVLAGSGPRNESTIISLTLPYCFDRIIDRSNAFVSMCCFQEGLLRIEYEIMDGESICVTDVSSEKTTVSSIMMSNLTYVFCNWITRRNSKGKEKYIASEETIRKVHRGA